MYCYDGHESFKLYILTEAQLISINEFPCIRPRCVIVIDEGDKIAHVRYTYILYIE